MIPSAHSYYVRRAREHGALARAATHADQRSMHERIVEAYTALARLHEPRRNSEAGPDVSTAELFQAPLEESHVRVAL